MAVNWNDVAYLEGLVCCLDELCKERQLPRPSYGSCDPEVMQFYFDLAEVYDTWTKAEAYGDRDQGRAAWAEVEACLRAFQPYAEAARRDGRRLESGGYG